MSKDTSTRRRATGPQAQPEQVLFSYLSRVATESSGRLSPAARNRFISSLRDTIDQERSRHGDDLRTLNRILEGLGDPVMLVDAEAQRDPESQARLNARLSVSQAGPQIPLTDEVAEWLALPSAALGGRFPEPTARHFGAGGPGTGPETCLDPDPFAAEYTVDTVGAVIDSGGGNPADYGGELLPELAPQTFDEPVSPVADRFRSVWAGGPRMHPQEAIAIAVFVIGAIFAQWVILLVAGLVACTSRFWNEREKWTLVIGVPIFTVLCYAIGFWMHQHGWWGGHKVDSGDLLSGAASFFGTLPRMTSILAAGYLVWRLARGITRQS
jgi:hypothetical protein